MRKINILSNVSNIRIDKFLAEEINLISRSKIKVFDDKIFLINQDNKFYVISNGI